MYDYIKGTLTDLLPSRAILENHGVGYSLWIPLSSFAALCKLKGQDTCLFVSFVVREDSQRLFGFIDRNEREVFEKLSEISGIGPKTALSIIGHLSLQELEHVIHEQDVLSLSKVPGIGKKTAERLILDMKDKLKHLKTAVNTHEPLSKEHLSLMTDALSALVHLGYHQATAQAAIKKTLKTTPAPLPLAELISLALKTIHSS